MSEKSKPQVTALTSAIIGGLTGAAEISITYPMEYTKTVMQLKPEIAKRGAITFAREAIGQRGILSKTSK